MNTAAITGNVATAPRCRVRGFVPTTTFDITVDFARRGYTFHVRAMNDLARSSRRLRVGDLVAVNGYLHAEAFDMPDCSIWHRVEIVAYEIDHHPHFTPATSSGEEVRR
jgi:hypothetical protein